MVAHTGKSGERREADRRQFDRFETELHAATVREDLHAQAAARCRLRLQDFSLGGLKAESPVRLKLNERLRLRLGGPAAGPVELTGRVRHCRRLDDRFEVGIEFCHGEGQRSPWRQLPRLFSLAYRSRDGIGADRLSH